MNGNRKRKLELNRETVRVLTSHEMAGVAGGAIKLSDICPPPEPPSPNTYFRCHPTSPLPLPPPPTMGTFLCARRA